MGEELEGGACVLRTIPGNSGSAGNAASAGEHIAAQYDPWREELTTAVPEIRDGRLTIPTFPGWGADVNEDVLREHPWPAA